MRVTAECGSFLDGVWMVPVAMHAATDGMPPPETSKFGSDFVDFSVLPPSNNKSNAPSPM